MNGEAAVRVIRQPISGTVAGKLLGLDDQNHCTRRRVLGDRCIEHAGGAVGIERFAAVKSGQIESQLSVCEGENLHILKQVGAVVAVTGIHILDRQAICPQ